MNDVSMVPPASSADVSFEQREIGRYGGETPGPCVLCVGGIHGNEPAGVLALQRVFAVLQRRAPAMRGQFIGFAGNLAALRQKRRYIHDDLNRVWQPERIRAMHQGVAAQNGDAEWREQAALLNAIDPIIENAAPDTYFLDLHTTSAQGPPFVVIGDTLPNRELAMHFPVPIVLGLEERLGGTLPSYVAEHGPITMGFESGQHDDPAAVDHAVAAIWLALRVSGALSPGAVPEADGAFALLELAAGDAPHFVDIRHRHGVAPEDDFCMEPGWPNFRRVSAGQSVAQDRLGPVIAPMSGLVLLPLYQKLGSDGFFVVRPVRRFWLRLSSWLRRLHADRLAHWLPGVERDSDRPDVLIVDPHIARWFVYEIFHLLGFRRQEPRGDRLIVSRRGYDEAPWERQQRIASSRRPQ